MLVIYQLFISLILFISPLIILIRLLNGKEDRKRFKEKFSIINHKSPQGKTVWFHAASVGEIMSIISILQYYEKKNEIKTILVTTSTLSSARIIENLKFTKVIHQFYPIDHFIIVKKFLDHWKPKIAIFLESEIWPRMFYEINKKNIPLILLIKKTYPQNQQTKYFLKKLGVSKLEEIGNLKYVENKNENKDVLNKKILKRLAKYKVWVAASTHEGEELFAAKAHILLKEKEKNLITIIIPRHINRVDKIVNELKNLNLKVITHSSKQKKFDDIDIYIVDTFGLSKNFYQISPTVLLGKSILHKGGQNPLEASRFNCNILHGPNIDNFQDIYKHLNELRISKEIKSLNDLVSKIKFKKNYTNSKKLKKISNEIFKKTIEKLNNHIN